MRHGQTVLLYFVAKSIATGVSFLATVYFARLLGAEILGVYGLGLAVVAWLEMSGNLGIRKAVVKRISEDNDPGEHLAAGALLMIVFFIIAGLVLVAGRQYVEGYIGAPVLEIVLLLVAASLLYRLATGILQGHHFVHVSGLLEPLRLLSAVVIQFGLVLIGLGLAGLLLGYGTGWVIAAVAGLLFLGPTLQRPTMDHIWSIISYARYAWLGTIRDESFRWIDVTVLGLFVAQGLVGIYLITLSIASFLASFSYAINTTLFPEISSESSKGDSAAVPGLVEDSLTYAGVFFIPGLVGSVLLADRLLLIYGQEFVTGATVLPILVAGFLVYSFQMQCVNALNAINRPDIAFRVNGLFIVANVGLNVVLVTAIGWVGAAIATGLAAVMSLVYGLYTVKRTIEIQFPVLEVGHQSAAALVMGLFVYAARQLGEQTTFAEYNFVFVFSLVGLGGGVYFLVLFVISDQFRGTVIRNLPLDVPLPVSYQVDSRRE